MQNTENLEQISKLADRIRGVISYYRDSVAGFAERIGVEYGILQPVVGPRGTKPSAEIILAIARITDISHGWLLTGEGKMLRGGEAGTDAGYINVPVYWDVVLSAGHGAIPPEVEEDGEMRPFMELELRQFSTNPHNLAIVKVTGTSMEPLLHAGDEVMVDFSVPVTLRDGLYAVRLGDVLLVKHLQRLPEGKIVLRSENPFYEPVEIDLEKEPEDFAVIGRVVWGARRY